MRLTVHLSWCPRARRAGTDWHCCDQSSLKNFTELILGKRTQTKEHCIPLAEPVVPKSFWVRPRPCGDSRYLGITKHLLGCRADLLSPYRPSGSSTASSTGDHGGRARESVELGGTHNMPPVQELDGVGGRDRRMSCTVPVSA